MKLSRRAIMKPTRRNCAIALWRGLRKRCPRCGHGAMFSGWYTLSERCETCELVFEPNDGDTWALMYVSTAAITGVFILVMIFCLRPSQLWIGRAILLPAALLAIVGTLPRRKGLAVALDYLSELLWNRPGSAAPENDLPKSVEPPHVPPHNENQGK